jgi:hypothetical protein
MVSDRCSTRTHGVLYPSRQKQDFESTKELAVVWVDGGVLVGVFLEGGSADMQASMPKLARARPRISSVAKLARMSVQEFFQVRRSCVWSPKFVSCSSAAS